MKNVYSEIKGPNETYNFWSEIFSSFCISQWHVWKLICTNSLSLYEYASTGKKMKAHRMCEKYWMTENFLYSCSLTTRKWDQCFMTVNLFHVLTLYLQSVPYIYLLYCRLTTRRPSSFWSSWFWNTRPTPTQSTSRLYTVLSLTTLVCVYSP